MQSVLVVNAGSSSVKFQIFEACAPDALRGLIKGQVDGIGTRPRQRAQPSDGSLLVDESYATTAVADVPAATAVAAEWLRQRPGLELIAVGHRVVHGGPDYDRPVLIDKNVLERLEGYAPSHRCINPTTSP